MKIFTVIEEDFAETVWGKAILEGMRHKAGALKHELYEVKSFDIDFGAQKRMIILMGTANTWINKTLGELSQKGIRGIVLNCQPTEIVPETSYILLDYACATYASIEYLYACGKKKIALFAINPNSITDSTKKRSFLEFGLSEKDIYITDDSLSESYIRLKENISDYDAVICANDIAAVALIRRLESDGISVPRDIYIVSFGNLLIGRYFSHSLTTMTLNDEELGRQAVAMYAYLVKSETDINVQMTIPCTLIPGMTTEYREVGKPKFVPSLHHAEDDYFYSDSDVSEMMKIENFLVRCDDTDFRIIRGILDGNSYADIGEKVYISENAVKYRVKRMLTSLSIESKSEFSALMKTYCPKIAER